MRAVIVSILAMLVLITAAQATVTTVRESHNISSDASQAFAYYGGGINITVNVAGIKNFTISKYTADNSVWCYLFHPTSSYDLIAQGLFSGNDCTIQSNITQGKSYIIAAGSGGASTITQRYATSPSLPITGTYLTFIRGVLDNHGGSAWVDQPHLFDIANITLYIDDGVTPGVDPYLNLSTNLVSHSNSSANPFVFYFNGTSTNNTNIYNCSLYLNSTLNQTKTDLDLTNNQNFSLDTSLWEYGKDFNVTCSNANTTNSFLRTNIFIDTINPVLALSRANHTVLYRGVDLYVNLTGSCSDTNLYSCNMTIYNSSWAPINSSQVLGINETSYNITLTRLISGILDGKYYVNITSADDHTAQTPKDLPWYFSNGSVIAEGDIIIGGNLKQLDSKGRPATYFYLSGDRYKFKATFHDSALIHYMTIKTVAEDLDLIEDSRYKAHFVHYGLKRWIDFEGRNIKAATVTKIDPKYYIVAVEHYTATDEVEFDSIGSLNVVTQTWDFNITNNNYPFQVVIYDEDTPSAQLPATLEVQFSYKGANATNYTTQYTKYTGSSLYAFNISANESILNADLYLIYTTANGFTHRYYLSNTTLNVSGQQNISVYNYNTTTGVTDLRLTVRYNSNYNYYPDIICKLQRRYTSEGVWRTVQMDKSGDFGLCFFNIREESTDYRLIFTDENNNILKTTESLKFACTSGICELTVLLDPYSAEAAETAISTVYSYDNSTKIATLTWNDASAGTNTVKLVARQETATGPYLVCNQTQTGASGVMTCNMTGRSGAVQLQATGNGDILINDYVNVESSKLGILVGNAEGGFWAAILMVTCVMFGIFSVVGAIISLIISLITIYLLGIFTPITVTFVIISAVIGIVIGFKVRS